MQQLLTIQLNVVTWTSNVDQKTLRYSVYTSGVKSLVSGSDIMASVAYILKTVLTMSVQMVFNRWRHSWDCSSSTHTNMTQTFYTSWHDWPLSDTYSDIPHTPDAVMPKNNKLAAISRQRFKNFTIFNPVTFFPHDVKKHLLLLASSVRCKSYTEHSKSNVHEV